MIKRCVTVDRWYFGCFYDDEFNLIMTGWFLWLSDDAAFMIGALREFQESKP